MSPQSKHYTWRRILDLVEERETTPGADAHLAECALCRELAAEARSIASALRFAAESTPSSDSVRKVLGRLDHYGPELVDAIAWARAEAARLSGAGQAGSTSAGSLLERGKARIEALLRATLVADSWATPAAGVRGSSTASPRILVYETAEYAVSLSLHLGADPEGAEFDIVGQVSPKKGTALPPGVVAALETATGSSVEAEVEPFGEFRFEGLHGRPVRVELRVGEDRIEVGPLPAMRTR